MSLVQVVTIEKILHLFRDANRINEIVRRRRTVVTQPRARSAIRQGTHYFSAAWTGLERDLWMVHWVRSDCEFIFRDGLRECVHQSL
jgi:hypothetical protein